MSLTATLPAGERAVYRNGEWSGDSETIDLIRPFFDTARRAWLPQDGDPLFSVAEYLREALPGVEITCKPEPQPQPKLTRQGKPGEGQAEGLAEGPGEGMAVYSISAAVVAAMARYTRSRWLEQIARYDKRGQPGAGPGGPSPKGTPEGKRAKPLQTPTPAPEPEPIPEPTPEPIPEPAPEPQPTPTPKPPAKRPAKAPSKPTKAPGKAPATKPTKPAAKPTAKPARPTAKPAKAPAKGKRGWTTVGGAPAFVDSTGRISKGCPGLKGELVDDLVGESDDSREEREHRQAAAQAKGLTGEDVTARDARALAGSPTGAKTPAEGKQATPKPEKFTKTGKRAAARKRVATPAERLRASFALVKAAAKQFGVSPPRILAQIDQVLAEVTPFWEMEAAAKADAHQMIGLAPSEIHRLEDRGKDIASKAGGKGRLARIDEVADSFMAEHPEAGVKDTQEFWEFLKKPHRPQPQPWDPDVIQDAAARAQDLKMRARQAKPAATIPEQVAEAVAEGMEGAEWEAAGPEGLGGWPGWEGIGEGMEGEAEQGGGFEGGGDVGGEAEGAEGAADFSFDPSQFEEGAGGETEGGPEGDAADDTPANDNANPDDWDQVF